MLEPSGVGQCGAVWVVWEGVGGVGDEDGRDGTVGVVRRQSGKTVDVAARQKDDGSLKTLHSDLQAK